MPLEEPSWWYGAGKDDLRVRALEPASRIYAWAARRRFEKHAPYVSSLPVICVGNFTAGGTGKTPLSLAIAGMLKARGATPAFLTRGYSGRLKGPVTVNPAVDLATDVGDEPLLLARAAPTVLSRDRAAGARLIESVRTASHILMDDGLQNPHLAKSLTIALVDGARGLGNGKVIPAGPLRLPLEDQFALADAIVVNGGDAGAPHLERLKAAFPGPVLEARAVPELATTEPLRDRDVVAFSGIGNPQRFTRLLQAAGARALAVRAFKDHHPFSEADAAGLLELARTYRAQLVTTAKDRARLSGLAGARGELAAAAHVVEITMELQPRDKERLESLVIAARAQVPART